MPSGKRVTVGPSDVASAILVEDWSNARKMMAVRLAEVFDQTESPRDMKSIARTLVALLKECEDDSARKEIEAGSSSYASILAEAEKVLADA